MQIPEFKLWSEKSSKIKEKISPTIGMRNLNDLGKEEKQKIWLILKHKGWFDVRYHKNIYLAVYFLNERFKKESYGKEVLTHGDWHVEYGTLKRCCVEVSLQDFYSVFMNGIEDVAFEMLSLFANQLISHEALERMQQEDLDDSRKQAIVEESYKDFDSFSECLNDIFEQFGINVFLTRDGLAFRQDKEISEGIYEPVLNFLSNPKWRPVNQELTDAFVAYRKRTHDGYSTCITKAITGLQAFL